MAWHISVDGSGATFCGVLAVANHHLTTTFQSSCPPRSQVASALDICRTVEAGWDLTLTELLGSKLSFIL